MNIYIPIEVKARELEGRGLLALTAAERGHVVILGEKKDTRGLCKKGLLPPGVLHEKSLTPSKSTIKYFNELRNAGYLITSQDEESGLTTESYDAFAKGRYSEKTISTVSRIFAWGEHDSRSLKKEYPQFSDRIVTTGSPRVDLWRKDFAPYFKDDAVVNNGVRKPFILIPSNFSLVLSEDRIWNIMARMRRAGYFERVVDGAFGEFRIYGDMSFRLKLIGEYVKMIRELSADFPNVDILVRPHPVEVVEAWEKMIGELPNVKVLRKGTISGWIRNASLIINNGCTSALEAAACGVPRIAYRPEPSDFEYMIPNMVCHQAMTLNNLKELVTNILNGSPIKDEDKVTSLTDEILGLRISNLQGLLAADRIVHEWEAIDDPATNLNSDVTQLFEVKKQAENKPLYLRCKRKLSHLKRRFVSTETKKKKEDKLLNNTNKFPDLKDEEIQSMITKFRKTLNRFHHVKYKRFGEKSFVIYSDQHED